MKILAIGNSFSQDSMRYPSMLCEGLYVVNAYYGGCTNEMHYGFYKEDKPCYSMEINGKTAKKDVTLREILQSDRFDYVLLGSGTHNWKDYGEIPPNEPWVEYLFEIIKEHQPNAMLGYHCFWADGITSKREIMTEHFNCDRRKMGDAFREMACKMQENYGIKCIIPCGDAVDTAYKFYGEKMFRDGFHMSEFGRYLLGCLYVELFTGKSPNADYIPSGEYGEIPNEDERRILRETAHKVIE